jgi:hypothetical protein
MLRRQLMLVFVTTSLLFVGAVGQTTANVIIDDFTGFPPHTPVGSATGLTISAFGGPGAPGTPVTTGPGDFGVSGLTNSTSFAFAFNGYPTNQILDFKFTTPASLVSLTFDNEGSSGGGRGDSFFQAFDAHGNLISSGFLPQNSGGTFPLVNIPGTGIAELQLNNGTGGTDNWVFVVGEVTFTVPEPTSLAVFGLIGIGSIGIAAWRRRKSVKA